MYSGIWLAIGLVMAAMYTVDAIHSSVPAYFVVAFGWALLGAIQSWRWRTEGGAGADPKRRPFASYLTVFAFLVIIGGVASRWWA